MQTFWNKTKHIFRHKNFKFMFLSQTFGNLGLNIQLVAISWLAYSLSSSEFVLGLIVSMQFLPLLLFGLYAGHITDKYSKYEFIKWLQIFQAVVPFVIFLAICFGFMNIFVVFMAAVFLGITRMFDSPLRAAILSYVVPKEDIKSAFSLASIASQIARVIGPVIGGLFLVYFPVQFTFLATAFGFLFVVILYRKMDVKFFYINHDAKNMESSFKDSLNYLISHKTFREISVTGMFLGIFFWSYTTYFPIIAKTIFGLGAKEFSYMISAYALGSIIGGLHSTHNEDLSFKYLRKLSIMFAVISSILVFIPNFYAMLFVIFVSGSYVSKINIVTNSLVRKNSEDKFLGTAVSLWMIITVGTTAIGSLYYGFVSQYFGVQIAVFLPAFIYLLYSVFYLRKE